MKLSLIPVTIFAICSAILAMNFEPPTAAERLKAIGATEGLGETLRRALEPADDFEPISRPQPGDWLAVHYEPGQTFDEFVKSKPNRPDKTRNKIYLQPLGEFPKMQVPLNQALKEYASAYFAMQVEMLPVMTLGDRSITTRINTYTRNRQILTSDVLDILKEKLPDDAFCLLAITMEDLYPEDSWNFVFGQASLRERVGVYSFARYDPAFYGDKRGKDYEKLILRRSCKVLVHETGHMFGLQHCIFFRCVMNGSNHLKESDSRPMCLCPVCLRKLQYSIGFDVIARYGSLYRFYRQVGFDDDARWIAHRLERILGAEAARTVIEQKSMQ
jgi:archaemetzincin